MQEKEEKEAKVNAFNSLTDSHITSINAILCKNIVTFQFLNGFSHTTSEQSKRGGIMTTFNSLTDSH